MKPKIKKIKEYPKITLEPEHLRGLCRDKCTITFKERYIEIGVGIDGTGNWFKLPYQVIKGIFK